MVGQRVDLSCVTCLFATKAPYLLSLLVFIYFRVQTIFILAVVSVLCCGAFFTLRGTARFLWRCLAPPVHSWLHHELM